MVAGNILNCLWMYHQYSQKDPDEISRAYSYRIGRYCTNAEQVEVHYEGGSCIICMRKESGRIWSLCRKLWLFGIGSSMRFKG